MVSNPNSPWRKLQKSQSQRLVELKCRCGKPAMVYVKPYGKVEGLCREHNQERLAKIAETILLSQRKARLKPKRGRIPSDKKVKNHRSLHGCRAFGYFKGFK